MQSLSCPGRCHRTHLVSPCAVVTAVVGDTLGAVHSTEITRGGFEPAAPGSAHLPFPRLPLTVGPPHTLSTGGSWALQPGFMQPDVSRRESRLGETEASWDRLPLLPSGVWAAECWALPCYHSPRSGTSSD